MSLEEFIAAHIVDYNDAAATYDCRCGVRQSDSDTWPQHFAAELRKVFAVVPLLPVEAATMFRNPHVTIPVGPSEFARVEGDASGRVGLIGVSSPFRTVAEAEGTAAAILSLIAGGAR